MSKQAPAAQSEQPSAESNSLVDKSLLLVLSRFTDAACGILGPQNKSREPHVEPHSEILQPGKQADQPSRTNSSQSLVGGKLPLANDIAMNENGNGMKDTCQAKSGTDDVEPQDDNS